MKYGGFIKANTKIRKKFSGKNSKEFDFKGLCKEVY